MTKNKAEEMPIEVIEAFKRIRSYNVLVTTVLYLPNGKWLFFDEEGEMPRFPMIADVGFLEDAQAAVEKKCSLPVAFQLPRGLMKKK
jgi:hypothetical protein